MILYNPTVSGSLLITGSLTTTGTLTAQTLVVQTITSSVDFVTGSSVNGSLSSNTHQFTGSVLMSGSLTVGSAATFSSDVTINGILNNRGSADNVTVQNYYRDGTYEFGVQKVSGRGTDLFFTGPDTNFNIAQRTTYGTLGGTVRFTVTSGGNVGIGTTSPSTLLHIKTTGDGYNMYTIESTGGDAGIALKGGSGGTSVGGWTIQGQNGGSMVFVDRNSTATTRLTLTSAGNVGIGTTSPASGYRTHIVASGSTAFLGISNQGTANGDRTLRIGFGGNGADTHASIQGTRLSIADDVNLALQPGGGQVIIGGTSIRSELGSNTKLSVSTAAIGSAQISGTGTLNLDISIDQFNAGLTLLFLASRNTSDGTSTASAVYIISFYYSGGNFPSIAYLGGTNNFVSFGSSGGKLTATNGSGGNAAYSWFTSR